MNKYNYLYVARNNYRHLEYLIEGKELALFNVIAVTSQQVAECYLKHLADVFATNSDDVKSVLLTHNLVRIDRLLKNEGIDLGLDRNYLGTLKDFYFTARYPGDEFIVVTEEEAMGAYNYAILIKNKAEDYLKSHGYCPVCGSKLLPVGVCSNTLCDSKLDEIISFTRRV